ncbi:MAG: mannose-1-phosphate guanylyltransferase [Anaerolineae bacterium]|nr:mannose-1-phosphate guanylyltransferase [Anaerolineae bacterium]
MFALILAGGAGTRLWPRSRASSPKQLLALGGDKTMMQATVNRILPIVSFEHIFVATNREYGPLIKEQVPDIPPQNIIEEPSGKNTAPCIGLAAVQMRRLDPHAIMVSLHADHFIVDEEGFRQALVAAAEVARQGYLVTLGITPNRPETGYGYVQRGAELGQYNDHLVYRVAQFLEKPDLITAEKFIASGAHYWNSGIFIWQISTLLEAFGQYMPKFYRQLDQMEQALAGGGTIDAVWQKIKPKSIDVGIMERAEKVAVVPVDIGWNDVGSWNAIHEINQADENGNVILKAEHIGFDTKSTLIQGNGRLVATIGLEDMVIVDSDDALLVCTRDRVQDIKQIVTWLEKNGRTDLL